ncbi:MAG: alanine dehydrogenase [Thermodesulfobacteriota bacterium]|jgi:alanine dehydrogenase
MIIGIPKELKVAEKRVAITPAGVKMLRKESHIVLIESGAGLGSGFPDESYLRVGAEFRTDPEEIWADSEMILKVKEPIAPEFDRMHEGQILFTFLHLAADKGLTEKLIERKIIGIAYETIQTEKGSLPLLAPMSAIAGRLSIQAGAYCLEAKNGGMGILLSGVPGVRPAYVVILGGGVAGVHACFGAVGNDARVSILDINQDRLNFIDEMMHGRVTTLISDDENIEEEVLKADLVISSVLIPGARAPKLISRKFIKEMKRGAAIVDIAIDQGGCCETSSPTTHDNPTYLEEGVVHYCVTNMPGVVPRTSTIALTNATLPYVLEIANKGYERAMKQNPQIARGINLIRGEVVNRAVAESLGMRYTPIG